MKSQQLYDLVDFLIYNKETIKLDILLDVRRFLDNEKLFKGIYLRAYNDAYKEFITSLVRGKLNEHFPLQLELITVIIDTNFLEDLLGDTFYDKSVFKGES